MFARLAKNGAPPALARHPAAKLTAALLDPERAAPEARSQKSEQVCTSCCTGLAVSLGLQGSPEALPRQKAVEINMFMCLPFSRVGCPSFLPHVLQINAKTGKEKYLVLPCCMDLSGILALSKMQ